MCAILAAVISVVHKNWSNVIRRFLSFFLIGFLTLLVELGFTAFLIYAIEMDSILAVGVSFFITLVATYFLFRKYTFKGTSRGLVSGFIYFSIIAISGLAVVMGGSYIAVEYFAINPLIARFFLAAISGLLNFLINLVYNFKVAHVH